MANPLFSTYSKAENRVTSTILAVFERLNSSTVTSILQLLVEDSTIELIKYENQISGNDSIPDGMISGLFDYLIETKIVPNSIDKKQIKDHCEFLKSRYDFSKLLVLTPDFECPPILERLKIDYPNKIIWANFDKIVECIDYIIEDERLLLDREKFLLFELKDFLVKEDLLAEDYSEKVLIVPAGFAWNEYKKYSIYKCQANRAFQKSSYMGFYADGEIKKFYPKILGVIDDFNIQTDNIKENEIITYGNATEEDIRRRIAELQKELGNNQWNEKLKYIILTSKDNKETIKHKNSIKNNKVSYTGKRTAYVQKQTYANLKSLEGKKFTSEI